MSSSSDDDLPDFAFGNILPVANQNITRINVDAEIAGNIARKEIDKEIAKEREKEKESKEEAPKKLPFSRPPQRRIESFPPNRPIFDPVKSCTSFNADTLGVPVPCPLNFALCTLDNADEFFPWIRITYKKSSDDNKRQLLSYLWLLISCHPDRTVVQKCYDALVEYNSSWRLKYEELIVVLKNWGVADGDVVSDIELDGIIAQREPSAVVSAYNVENVLQVLRCQLVVQDLEGHHDLRKTVFILLSLLTLDKAYQQCLSDVSACLELLSVYAKAENPLWVEIYCHGLFQAEFHHAQLAYLIECVVPQSMRWCLCLAYCQQLFSLNLSFQATPDPALLQEILHAHMDTVLKLECTELHSLISIVDAGLSLAVSYEVDYSVRRGLILWLRTYMERRIERKSADLDVDAQFIAELVSRLQAEWEAAWFLDSGAHNNSIEEIEFLDADNRK